MATIRIEVMNMFNETVGVITGEPVKTWNLAMAMLDELVKQCARPLEGYELSIDMSGKKSIGCAAGWAHEVETEQEPVHIDR